jgi:glycosyltransferase involved in cell wall biosynthesis
MNGNSSINPASHKVALLQRAVAHYRYPLFEKLSQADGFRWTFFCDEHDDRMSTGLAAASLASLDRRRTHNRRLVGPVLYQSGVSLKGYDAFMLDLGWTILSNPRYLIEARVRGIATIGWSKGIPQDPSKPDSAAKRAVQKTILSLCDTLVLYGEISREYFLNLGFPAERMFVAQNTIDTRRIASEASASRIQAAGLREKMGLNGRFVFGYLGTLVARKRIDVIIQAFEQVRDAGVDAVLVLAGGGPAREKLESIVRGSRHSTEIILPGRIPVGEEGGWFNMFDVYLSFAEGGLGILEAMANGKTVLATPEHYPETEHLEDGVTALLSRDFSVAAFAERMVSSVGSTVDLASIGNAARERVLANATLEKMVQSIQSAVRAGIQRRVPHKTSAISS